MKNGSVIREEICILVLSYARESYGYFHHIRGNIFIIRENRGAVALQGDDYSAKSTKTQLKPACPPRDPLMEEDALTNERLGIKA